jgi:hypothetical protein
VDDDRKDIVTEAAWVDASVGVMLGVRVDVYVRVGVLVVLGVTERSGDLNSIVSPTLSRSASYWFAQPTNIPAKNNMGNNKKNFLKVSYLQFRQKRILSQR